MSFNQALVERSRRRGRLKSVSQDITLGLLEPFKLRDMYPTIEAEDPKRPGYFVKYKHIGEHQQKIHSKRTRSGRPYKAVLFSGGFGSGKTLTTAIEIFSLLRQYAGLKVVCTAPYDYFFDETVFPVWWSVVGEPGESAYIKSWNAKSKILKMMNGSQIRFHAYDDPNKVRGWEAHVLWIEEAAEIGDGNNDKALAIFKALIGRLRAKKPAYPLRIYVTQNPRGHNWVWKLFIKSEPYSRTDPPDDFGYATQVKDRFGKPLHKVNGEPVVYREWEKVTASGDVFYTVASGTQANAEVPPGYVATMLGLYAETPGLRERLVDGMFTPVNTLVYELPWFSKETHCIDYQSFLDYWEITEIPTYWPVIVGIDCAGARSPWAVEAYVQAGGEYGGHWVGFDEIYEAGLTWGQIADKILDKFSKFESIRYFIDPISSSQRSGPMSETIMKEFTSRGIPCTAPKGYNLNGGISKVYSFLRRDHSTPCPYQRVGRDERGDKLFLDDVQIEDESGNITWENGHAQLYYLTNIPGRSRWIKNEKGDLIQWNEEGHACPSNIAEKGVYRWDEKKNREPKESEEGLSPVQSQKPLNRDDHAITSEFFAFMGMMPDDSRWRRKQSREQPDNKPVILYGQSRRRSVF